MTSCLLHAQTPATTTVKDTVYRSDGSLTSGTVVIAWPAFVTSDAKAVFGGTKTLQLTNGALAVALAPNSGGTPSGTSYNVKYYQSSGVFFEETWVVPTSSPVASPAAPTSVTQVGTPGTTTYYYWVSATNANGETLLGPSRVTTTSNATLSMTNYNVITWASVSGATGYRVWRTNTSTAPTGTGNYLVGSSATTTINDQSNTLTSAAVPTLNTTDPRTLSQVRVTAAPSSTVTLAASQVQGTAIVSNPSSTQTITAPPSGIPLQVKGRSSNSANVFELYDNQSTPALRSWFDLNGAFKTSQAPTFSTLTSGSLLFAGTGGVLSQDNTNLFWDDTGNQLKLSDLASKIINRVRFADQFAGANAGAKIVAAITDLPSTGGTVDARGLEGGTISQDLWGGTTKPFVLLLGAGTYTVSAAQVVTSYSQIIGLGHQTVWNYTPTTGTAFTFNYPAGLDSTYKIRAGLNNLYLSGPGSGTSAVGVLLGGTNGAFGFSSDGLRIGSFGTAIKYGDNTWITDFNRFSVIANNRALDIPSGLTGTGENLSFRSGVFANCATFANGVLLAQSTTAVFDSVSFDNCQIAQSAGETRFTNVHIENPGQNVTSPFISLTGGTMMLDQATILQGQSSGSVPGQLINVTGGSLMVGTMTGNSNLAMTDVITAPTAPITFLNIFRGANITNTITQGVAYTGRGPYNNNGPSGDLVLGSGASWNAILSQSSGSVFSIANGGSQRFYLDPNGKVGIGATPNTKLDVSGAIRSTLTTVTFSATPTFDASLGNSFKMTLTANVTSSTISNAQTGEFITLLLCQDSTGSRTMTWPTNLKLSGGSFTLTTTANKCDSLTAIYDGTNWYETARTTNL